MLRETDPQAGLTLWEAPLPEQARQPPAELAAVDAYLDDECFLGPWRTLFDRRIGRPRSRSTCCCGCCTSNTAISWATRA